MNNISIISLYGLMFGIIGTALGGIIGTFLNINSNKFFSFILELASGLMTAIICFDLIPESLAIINITLCIIGIFAGVFSMVLCDNFIKKICSEKKSLSKSHLLRTGIIIAIGISIHNFPEGVAIGAGFNSSETLGFKLAIAIALHDIPEGISIALPLKKANISYLKTIIITVLSGLTTGFGATLGAIVGNISKDFIGFSLSFAAGAMLYIVSCELIPESKSLYKGRFSSFGNMIGLAVGIFSKCI